MAAFSRASDRKRDAGNRPAMRHAQNGDRLESKISAGLEFIDERLFYTITERGFPRRLLLHFDPWWEHQFRLPQHQRGVAH